MTKLNVKKIVEKYQQLDSNRHQLINNFSWLLVEKLLSMGVSLFVGVWVARYLGVEQFGLYNYALSFVALFAPLNELGLQGIVIRDLVREPESNNEILGTAFILKLIGGISTLFLTVAITMYMRPGDSLSQLLIAIVALSTILQAFNTIDFWFQSQIRSKYTVVSKTTAFFIVSAVKVWLIKVQAPLVAFALAGVLQIAFSSVGLIASYYKSGALLKSWSVNIDRAKNLLKESWPLLFSGIAIMIQARIDQIMLGQMIGDSEVGQYSVAMRLIEVFAFVPIIVCQSVAPKITQAKLKSQEIYFFRLKNLYRIMFILFLLISIPVFFTANRIVLLLFGQEYQSAGSLLSLFSIRLFFANFGVVKSLFITNESLFKYSLITAILGSVVNVIMNYILIPKYASAGALWATIASFATTIFIIDIFYPRMRNNLRLMFEAILTPWKLKFDLDITV
jgi:O-antigen/teichoic acid export membrane protein